MLADIRRRKQHMSYVDFLVCKRRLKCWLCDFLFSRQNGAERKQRPIFTFFPPPFSSHSARHRLLLLGYPLSGKSTRQLSTYKRKNYWIYKLSIYFSNARFHMLFGFRPARCSASHTCAGPSSSPGPICCALGAAREAAAWREGSCRAIPLSTLPPRAETSAACGWRRGTA